MHLRKQLLRPIDTIRNNFQILLMNFQPLKVTTIYNIVSIVTDHCDTKSTKCGENLSAGSTGGCYRNCVKYKRAELLWPHLIDNTLQ